jgi:hypothetical protein
MISAVVSVRVEEQDNSILGNWILSKARAGIKMSVKIMTFSEIPSTGRYVSLGTVLW